MDRNCFVSRTAADRSGDFGTAAGYPSSRTNPVPSADPYGSADPNGGMVGGSGDLDADCCTERCGRKHGNRRADRHTAVRHPAGGYAGTSHTPTNLDEEAVMTENELEQIMERLRQRRIFDEIFVLILERNSQGDIKLLDYGLKEIGEISAWLAVQKEKQNHEKRRTEG